MKKAQQKHKPRFGERAFAKAPVTPAEEIVAYGEVTYRADSAGIIQYRPGQYATIEQYHQAMQLMHGVEAVGPLENGTFVVMVPLTQEQAERLARKSPGAAAVGIQNKTSLD